MVAAVVEEQEFPVGGKGDLAGYDQEQREEGEFQELHRLSNCRSIQVLGPI